MANTNSNIVAQRFTSPPTLPAVGQSGGRLRVVGGNFEVATADITAASDTMRLTFLPQNARIWHISVGGDSLDGATGLIYDIGLYDPGALSTAPGTVNDQNIFASALTALRAATDPGTPNVVAESVLAGFLANYGERLWEIAGDTEGDFKEYEIVLTITTPPTTDVAGTIAWMIWYSID